MKEKNVITMEGTVRSVTDKKTRKEDLEKETESLHVQNTDGHVVRASAPKGYFIGLSPGEQVKITFTLANKTLTEE